MFKKLLVAAMLAVFLTVGCASAQSVPKHYELPAHIQKIEDNVNKMDGARIDIIDYRDDGSTLWTWVDNSEMPALCDYVVVLGIINKDEDKYKPLFVINKNNAADPCQRGYIMYKEYLAEMKKAKADLPKVGI